MASTTPTWSGNSIESPMAIVSSTTMNKPVIKSCTSVCAPKPMASPTTPAPASSGVTLTPRLASTAIIATTSTLTNDALRTRGRMVLARRLGCAARPCVGESVWVMAVSISSQASHASSTTPTTPSSDSVMWRPAAVDWAIRISEVCQIRALSSRNVIQITTRISAAPKRPKRWTYAERRRSRRRGARTVALGDRPTTSVNSVAVTNNATVMTARRRNSSAWPVAMIVPMTDAATTASTGRYHASPARRSRSIIAGYSCRTANGRNEINWPMARRNRTANTPIRIAARILDSVLINAARLRPSAAITRGSLLTSPSAANEPVMNSRIGEWVIRSRTACARCADWNSVKMTWQTADITAPATIA